MFLKSECCDMKEPLSCLGIHKWLLGRLYRMLFTVKFTGVMQPSEKLANTFLLIVSFSMLPCNLYRCDSVTTYLETISMNLYCLDS